MTRPDARIRVLDLGADWQPGASGDGTALSEVVVAPVDPRDRAGDGATPRARRKAREQQDRFEAIEARRRERLARSNREGSVP
ncbi:ATP/GTP-binding protein, partial [Micromonospora zhanjiangensis]